MLGNKILVETKMRLARLLNFNYSIDGVGRYKIVGVGIITLKAVWYLYLVAKYPPTPKTV